jgi:hypothetical protein
MTAIYGSIFSDLASAVTDYSYSLQGSPLDDTVVTLQ